MEGDGAPADVAKPASARFRNALVFALGMVAPATVLVLWFGILTRPDRWKTSPLVLSTIFFVVGETLFIATALLPFLVASVLLRRGAPIRKAVLFWSGCVAGCLPGLGYWFDEEIGKPLVILGWLTLAFFAACAVLLACGHRVRRDSSASIDAPAPVVRRE